VAGFDGLQLPVELRSLAREFGLGGVILFARNVAEPGQVAELSYEAARLVPDVPLWVSIDQEGGRVARLKSPFTEWPPMAALGRSGDVGLVERFARALAAELRAVGVTLDYAPVLDVHTNSSNPVIGDRALSGKAEEVARYGAALIRTLQAEGIAACGKHFPGHGDTSTDSHLELPLVEHPPERLRQVEFVRGSARELTDMVGDLLDLAKVEAGKITMRPSAFTVHDLFGGLRGVIRPLQQREAVALLFDSADDVPSLFTDEGKVAQILRNYLSNALKFTEHGEIRVSAAVDADGTVTLQVRDTGIGIAADDQQRLFQEFGQVPNRLQARVRGTGLGLSLSKRLAELLGGTVGVISTPGEGSTFWLRIPATLPGHAAAQELPVRQALDQSPLVLVVDDEQAARYVLRRFLTKAGCRVIEASGGEDALFRAASDQPDVIFLDLRMPDMLGTEVLARLKRERATADIPVIIATSQVMDRAEEERISNHAVAILSKARLGNDDGAEEIKRAVRAAGVPLPL